MYHNVPLLCIECCRFFFLSLDFVFVSEWSPFWSPRPPTRHFSNFISIRTVQWLPLLPRRHPSSSISIRSVQWLPLPPKGFSNKLLLNPFQMPWLGVLAAIYHLSRDSYPSMFILVDGGDPHTPHTYSTSQSKAPPQHRVGLSVQGRIQPRSTSLSYNSVFGSGTRPVPVTQPACKLA